MKWWQVAIVIAAALLLGYIGGKAGRTAPETRVVERVDTLIVRDTITAYRAISEVRRVVDTLLLPVTDTIWQSDTVFVTFAREQLEWSDSLSTVWASGVLPRIDSVKHYTMAKFVTIEKVERPRWGIGVTAGYGVSKGGLSPYIGIGLSFNILSL